MDHSDIPVIDIAPLRLEPASPRAKDCVAAIDRACTHMGFFVVTGHGLEQLLGPLFSASRAFFAQPQRQKENTPRVDRYGFIPHKSQAIDTTRMSDNTEFLDMGMADEMLMPAIDGFTTAVRSYQAAALATAGVILRALAVSLGLDENFFDQRMNDPQCRLRFLHYPIAPVRADGSLPVPNKPHTDYGAITLLATDGVPGLEAKTVDGSWTPVVAPEEGLVVNLGDMLARWTNDRYKSTPHRVVGSPSQDRFSIPFFINPDPNTVVECIPSCFSADRGPRYGPVTASEFLAGRIDGSTETYVDPLEGPQRFAD